MGIHLFICRLYTLHTFNTRTQVNPSIIIWYRQYGAKETHHKTFAHQLAVASSSLLRSANAEVYWQKPRLGKRSPPMYMLIAVPIVLLQSASTEITCREDGTSGDAFEEDLEDKATFGDNGVQFTWEGTYVLAGDVICIW